MTALMLFLYPYMVYYSFLEEVRDPDAELMDFLYFFEELARA